MIAGNQWLRERRIRWGWTPVSIREPQHTPVSHSIPQKIPFQPQMIQEFRSHKLLVGGSFWVCSFRGKLWKILRQSSLHFYWLSTISLEVSKNYGGRLETASESFIYWSFKRDPFINGLLPIGSMYGIFTYIWLIFMVNVGKYTIITWILWVIIFIIPR